MYVWYLKGYFVVSAAVGLCVTRLLRRNEKSKHSLILGVKWVLRSAGAVYIHTLTYINIYIHENIYITLNPVASDPCVLT
jgi:hypothetical protein